MIVTDVSILRLPSTQVSDFEVEEILKLLEKELLLFDRHGVGLAAPQIGILKQVAIIRTKEHSIDLVNPTILEMDNPIIARGEGCLSIPNVSIDTLRFGEVFVKCDKNPSGIVATGLEAIAIQHEIDHLGGILMTDRILSSRIGRNSPCPCGRKIDGKVPKFKRCHGR